MKKKQNNKGVNALIWKHCPKDIYEGVNAFEICAVSVVISFNDAMVGLFRVLAKFDIITDSNYASTK